MNFDNDEDALEFINRLLERMHQVENEKMKKSENEKSFVINIYERGSQHIDTQINNPPPTQPHPLSPSPTGEGGSLWREGRKEEAHPQPGLTPDPDRTPYPPRRLARGDTYGGKGGEKPEVLSTEAAMALWEKVQQAGYVDAHCQPLISRTQAALLADVMAERLGIREKWKVFETLWNRTKMYKDYYEAVDQKQFLPFLNKLKQILD